MVKLKHKKKKTDAKGNTLSIALKEIEHLETEDVQVEYHVEDFIISKLIYNYNEVEKLFVGEIVGIKPREKF